MLCRKLQHTKTFPLHRVPTLGYLVIVWLIVYHAVGRKVPLPVPSLIKLQSVCLKPIFHQNANSWRRALALGNVTQRQSFALPNAKYTNMLVYFALGDAHFSRFTQRET